MTLARIARFLARHFVGTWCAIAFTPMVFASGLEGVEAEDTYKIGVLLLFFIVPVAIFPLFALGEWLWRNRQWKRTLVFLSSALIPAGVLLAGTITGNADTIFRGNVLFACVVLYWLASNGADIVALAVASHLKNLRRQEEKGPNQASEATSEPAPGAASSSPQG